MKKVKNLWPFILIGFIVLLFFYPIFQGKIPFPGDILADSNPYRTQSFFGYQANGYPNKAQGPDVIHEIYPWRYFSINQLKNGSIPFWNPHNFTGNPQIADFQTAIFYPLNFLYFVLPFNVSWTLIIMLEPLLAGFFMYLFLKKAVGLKDFSSFIGGVSFAFSSYITVWIEYGNIGSTIMFLPLALLFTSYFFNKFSPKNFLAIILTLSLSILAGYIQGAFYIYVLCFLYYGYLTFTTKDAFKDHKKNFLFLISLILPLFLTLFQILPTLTLFSQSTRGAYTLSQIQNDLAPIFNLTTIFFPDFFGNPATRNYWIDGTYIERVMYPGSVILFFAFYALISKVKFLEKRFFTVVSIMSLIVATNLPFIKFLYLLPISVVSTTIPTRELSVFIFSFIVLGAIGLDYFLEEKQFKKVFAFIYLGFFALVWAVIFILIKMLPSLSVDLKISEHNLILPTVLVILTVVAVIIKKINKNLTLILITFLVVLDLFYFFNKITPFAPSALTYPQTPIMTYLEKTDGINRFWGYGSAYISSNFQSVDNTYSPEGNDPLHISRYGALLSSSLNGKPVQILPKLEANVGPGYGTNDLKNNFYRKRVLDLVGVKYILDYQDVASTWSQPDITTFPKNEFSLIEKIYPWQVYENLNVVPRFFITNNYVLSKNKSQTLSLIYDPSIDLKKTVILEESPSMPMGSGTYGSVSLIKYTPNEVLLKVSASENKLLFLSDNYYPEWSVEIDGVPSKILIADYTFRAVAIPKGNHTVEFFYDPKSFKWGLGISLLTLLFIVLATIYGIINPKGFKNNELIKK